MSMRRNMLTWDVFFSLIRTGNITETAAELDQSVANVSKIIKSLETSVGVQLFDRSARPFRPTAQAVRMAAEIEPAYLGFRNAVERTIHRTKAILLRVSAPIDLAEKFISDQLMDYAEEHLNIRFELLQTQDLNHLLKGEVDVALTQHPLSAVGLNVRPCITCSCCPLASPKYLAVHGEPQTLDDLRSHTGLLLRWSGGMPTSFLFNSQGEPSGLLHWGKIFITNNQNTLKHLVLAHRGITVDLAASNVIDELEQGLLQPILTGWRRSNWDLCVVTKREQEKVQPELRRFADWWSQREGRDSMERTVRGNAAIKQLNAQRINQ